jgi:hypothetical protein
MKSLTRSINLTLEERCLITKSLRSVEDCMEFDEDYGEYTDGGRFILSLDAEELKALKSVLKKI